ncbi:iron complex transport system permease protein [Crenobacter luteus]|uniref:iron ABC transporter permease n=1 Tax=Crenobacter luteus TaxID=1452487 RepID=UPI00104D65A5|nr:iron ABC transporter permease [Crenobacter luteus]TCP11135.1 iron complex transport system permease protein [Crenobacter luteus]
MSALPLAFAPPAGLSRAALLGLSGLALLAAVVALRLGPDAATLLAEPGTPSAGLAAVLLFELDLPRVLAALVAGAALGVSGALFQALTRNPLASPDLLGVTGGAQLGVFAAIMLPSLAGVGSVPLLFASGLFAAALAAATAGGWRASPLRLILAGTACSLFFGAVVNMMLTIFEESIVGVAMWGNGSLYRPGAGGLTVAAAWALPPLLALPWLVRPLGVAQLGDAVARTVGVPLAPLRVATVATATAFAAVAVAVAGPMGFVGLVAPNLLRAAGVHRLPALLPLSALWAALLLAATDGLVVGLDLDNSVSTGVMIALVGTPLLLLLIHRNRRLGGLDAGAAAPSRAAILPLGAFVGLAALLLAALAALAAAAGGQWLTPARAWAAFAGDDVVARLLIDIRLPRVLVAMVAGAMLAASGALLQSVAKNPLAGPEVLGLTQGAGLATLAAQVVWPLAGRAALFGAAFAGGAAVLAAILLFNRRHRLAPLPVALTGIALGALCVSLSQWLIVQSSVQPARFLVWLIGGTYGKSLADLAALAPWLIVALPLMALLARPLDLTALGDESAAALGVPVARLRLLAMLLATALSCAAVAVVGPVAFVGLMTPHLARLMGFHSLGQRLPAAMCVGAMVLGAADVAGRLALAPLEVPAGVMTALIGTPYLLAMLIAGARRQR